MASKKHTHRYKFINIGKVDKPRKVYTCADADCTHYMHTKSLVTGKKSRCWQCGEEFIMTADIVSREIVKPRCVDCRSAGAKNDNLAKLRGERTKPVVEERKEDDAIASLLAGLKGGFDF